MEQIGQMVVQQGCKMVAGYMSFDESLEALKAKVNQLCCQANDMKTELMEKERGGQRKRKREVESWLQQAEQLEKDFKTFSESIPDGGSIMEKARKATKVQHLEKMTERVEKLRDEGRNFGEITVSLNRVYPLIVDPLSGRTSQSNLEEIYEWLGDENVRSIGVYGMGGVGKTTLAKHIYNKKKPLGNVYWVTVSQDFNMRKLQDDIIKTVGLTIFEENEEQRAAILCSHLVENNVVLILDDVWDNIPLEKLGVPLRVKGCKLILTTRLRDVCRKIGCQKLFQVNVFNEEGWNLFKEILVRQGNCIVLTDAIEKYAKELAKKCGGLPLALNVVAASMRGVNDDHVWRNAIKNFQDASLQMEDLENNVFEILKFSYNRLNDQRLKECFLYCCLYPEDCMIEKHEIIMKLIAEGLCEDIDEGHSILNKLVDVFLLEVGKFLDGRGYVKMHDLMREMALKISKFMAKSELTEIPEEKYWIAELERVSIFRSKIKEIPDGFSPRCHSLSTLILQRPNCLDAFPQLQIIPESFLLYMRTQLRVLDLSYNKQLECLPNSISNLENLCGLFLYGCKRISCLPGMKKLRALKVLDISYCKGIRELPQDMECLVSLQYLNIEGCVGIRELPEDMECLVSLQYLYMRDTSILEIPKGVIAKLRNLRCLYLEYCPSLQSEEVNCLTHLQEFTNRYDDLHSFNNTTLVKKLEQLKCYGISVGCCYAEQKSRSVYFSEIYFKGQRGQEVKVLLPANICSLKFQSCFGLDGCISDHFHSMSNNLSELIVGDSYEAEWIWDSKQIIENAASNTGATPFKCPEKLHLKTLQRLVSLFKGEDVITLPDCTFSSLKHLYIFQCPRMKKLLSVALLQNLQNLEKLEVAWCDNLEVVIRVEDEEGSSNTRPSSSSNISCLPKLKHLKLMELPKLKSICNVTKMVCPSIEKMCILGCQSIKRMPSFLPIDEASKQPYLPSSFQKIDIIEKEWWDSLEWHNPNEKDILESLIIWWRR